MTSCQRWLVPEQKKIKRNHADIANGHGANMQDNINAGKRGRGLADNASKLACYGTQLGKTCQLALVAEKGSEGGQASRLETPRVTQTTARQLPLAEMRQELEGAASPPIAWGEKRHMLGVASTQHTIWFVVFGEVSRHTASPPETSEMPTSGAQ